eukprot:scaffold286458_cov56-Prasinocladus_malaysianus.AAC.1
MPSGPGALLRPSRWRGSWYMGSVGAFRKIGSGSYPGKLGRSSAGRVSKGNRARGSIAGSLDRACLCWDFTAETTDLPPLGRSGAGLCA